MMPNGIALSVDKDVWLAEISFNLNKIMLALKKDLLVIQKSWCEAP